ncbi:unnamed protein product [Rhizoctonia solani]|uniref:FAD/NAD(P)-binding domain-containing protein n=1 Tax=Rhizoctonia solani TaxID=456999 RepID=A0A8H3CRN3_9AGAM|nr:unnamed protein product [Rhizoctonia solani]
MRLSRTLSFAMATPFVSSMKTILIMGGSYGGIAASKFLSKELPEGYRVVLLERNSHANHLYVLPRFSVLSSHEYKAFIPYNHIFGPTPGVHRVVHGTATKLERNRVTYTPAAYALANGEIPNATTSGTQTIEFDYLIYALGARLPGPIDFWGAKNVYEKSANLVLEKERIAFNGTKPASISFLQTAQKRLREVESVLVVGGGALGIQFASDLKDLYPQKQITLLHSRMQLLPKFPEKMHDEINQTMHKLNVNLMLGQRLDLKTTLPENAEYDQQGRRVVMTESGKKICADLILLCTGQMPNTDLMRKLAPLAVDEKTGLIKVLRTMQVGLPQAQFTAQGGDNTGEVMTMPHIYAIGDAADAFGAIKAGHTAHWQAEVASKNILASISSQPLTLYEPGPPAIKLTLGLRHYATIMGPEQTITVGDDGKDDLDAPSMWPYVGADFEKDQDL